MKVLYPCFLWYLAVTCSFISDAFENVGYMDLLQTPTHISNENFASRSIIYGSFSGSVILASFHRLLEGLAGIYHPMSFLREEGETVELMLQIS